MITKYTQGMIEAIQTTDVFGLVTGINLIITLCLNIAWILVCMRQCYRTVNRYLTCKRTPDLHPIYKDVQYLSRQRNLYNLETHIVKYVLVILCMSVEVVGLVCTVVLVVYDGTDESNKMSANRIEIEHKYYYPNCYIHPQIWKLYSIPLFMWFQNIFFLVWFLLSVLISILTRYLAARYLNHPFYKTLYRYIVWISVQFCIVAFCSSKLTFIFSYFVFPLLFLINWLLLLRDSRILCRVLRSNLTELELHSYNRVLYHEQVSGYRCYRFFQKVLLTSLLFFVIVTIIFRTFDLIDLFNNSFCLLNIVYRFNYTPRIHIPLSVQQITLLKDIICKLFSLIYSLSSSLPIICVTLIPLTRACVKRYKSHYMVYRYNYENTRPLIRR